MENSDSYNYQNNQNNWALVGKSKTIQLLLQAQTAGPKCQTNYSPLPPLTPNWEWRHDGKQSQLPPKINFMITVQNISFIILQIMYKVWGLSCSCCAYLTERRSCLLSLILTRMYPTWCHHSTRLKILLSVNADIEKVPPVGCEKICSTRSQFTPQFWPDFLVHLLLRRGKETRVFAFCFALTWHVAPLVSVKQHERNINARSLIVDHPCLILGNQHYATGPDKLFSTWCLCVLTLQRCIPRCW